MTTHDFQDGNGPVPAHQHANGGGWVWVHGTANLTEGTFEDVTFKELT